MSGASNGVSRRSLMTATALASLAAVTGCGGGSDAVAAPPAPVPPPPPAPPVTSKFLYTANGAPANTIGAYSISATNGSLAQIVSPLGAMNKPERIVAHPNGKWIYVTSRDTASSDGLLTQYTANASGQLSVVPTTPITLPTISTFFSPLEFHPDGTLLYVGNVGTSSILTYSVDSATGELTLVFPFTGVGLQNNEQFFLKAHPNKKFLVVSYLGGDVQVCTLKTTGEIDAVLASTPASLGTSELAFNPTGTVFYTSDSNGPKVAAYDFDVATGAVAISSTIPASYPSGTGPATRFLVHPNGAFVITNSASSAHVLIFQVGPSGGLAGGISYVASGIVTSLGLNRDGTVLYAGTTTGTSNRVNVFSVSPVGVLTLTSSASTGDNPVAIAVANL